MLRLRSDDVTTQLGVKRLEDQLGKLVIAGCGLGCNAGDKEEDTGEGNSRAAGRVLQAVITGVETTTEAMVGIVKREYRTAMVAAHQQVGQWGLFHG